MRTVDGNKSGTVGKKRDLAVFGTSLKKIGERVSVHKLRQISSLFYKGKACSFTGDRAKRPMGMKARLARSLGSFARREKRNQV